MVAPKDERIVRYRLIAGPLVSTVYEKSIPRDLDPPKRVIVAAALNGGVHHEVVFSRDATKERSDGVMNYCLSDCYRVTTEDGKPEYYHPKKWEHRACRCTWKGE